MYFRFIQGELEVTKDKLNLVLKKKKVNKDPISMVKR